MNDDIETGDPSARGIIDCRQILQDDATVFSRQRLVFPSPGGDDITPLSLLERYLNLVHRTTAGIVRPVRSPLGIDFRILGTGLSLISFIGPRLSTGGGALGLAICGGILV